MIQCAHLENERRRHINGQLTWKQRFDFAALSTWIIASIGIAILAFLGGYSDFRGYYAAAVVFVRGGNPYDYAQIAPVLVEMTGVMSNHPFYYPPWFAFFLAPFTAVSYTTGRIIWLIISIIAWTAGLFTLSALFKWPAIGWRRWLLFLLATYLFAWSSWNADQISSLLFLCFMGALWAICRRHDVLAGVLLTLTLTKPNISFVLVGVLLLWLLFHRRWRSLGAFAGSLIGLLAVASLFVPNWYRPLFESGSGQSLTHELSGVDQIVAIRINTTMLDWLTSFGLPDAINWPLYATVAAICGFILLWAAYRLHSPIAVASLAATMGFIITPYALQYDYPLMTITLFYVLYLTGKMRGGLRWGATAVTVFIATVPIWERPISDGFWIALGLSGLALLLTFYTPTADLPDCPTVSSP